MMAEINDRTSDGDMTEDDSNSSEDRRKIMRP